VTFAAIEWRDDYEPKHIQQIYRLVQSFNIRHLKPFRPKPAISAGKNRSRCWRNLSRQRFENKNSEVRIMTIQNLIAQWPTFAPQLRSVLRIMAAFMFIQAGTMKLFAFPMGMPPDDSTAKLMSQVGLAGILETFGGALLLLGLFTRPVAFILSGEMAVAYFQFQFPQSFWPIVNNGVSAVLYCFVWLYFSAAGAGPWSLDAKRGK
jgi:putative oxidoreductase